MHRNSTVKRWIALTWVTVEHSPLTSQNSAPDMSPSRLITFGIGSRHTTGWFRKSFVRSSATRQRKRSLTRFECGERFDLANDLIRLMYLRRIGKSDRNSKRNLPIILHSNFPLLCISSITVITVKAGMKIQLQNDKRAHRSLIHLSTGTSEHYIFR